MLHARVVPAAFLCVFLLDLARSAAFAAPYVAGNRAFPVTPTTEDPFVADELLIGGTSMRFGATSDEPAQRESEYAIEIEKRITDSFGISLEGSYKMIDPAGGPNAYGFDNLEGGLKYQFFTSDRHETVLSAGVLREFGGTGSESVGAEGSGATTPILSFGKGFGDLPEALKFLRPIAITGTLGYQIPDDKNAANILLAGASLQYSLRYLQGNVQYVGLPIWLTRLTPLVEFTYSTPLDHANGASSTGVIAPGLVYSEIGLDFGVEALIPMTRDSGTWIGLIAKLAVSFDRLGAASLAKPLFGN
jgi:hypothetical protein